MRGGRSLCANRNIPRRRGADAPAQRIFGKLQIATCRPHALEFRWGLGAGQCFGHSPFCCLLTSCVEVGTYRRSGPPDAGSPVVTRAIRQAFAEAKLPGTPQVSRVRPAHPVSPGDWLVCLRSNDAQHRLRYALYFTGFTFVRSQIAVIADRCDEEDYVSFVADAAIEEPLRGRPMLLGHGAYTKATP